jgi:RNA polymerase sigma-70 factor (ECF subfamily)
MATRTARADERSLAAGRVDDQGWGRSRRALEPDRLPDHIDALYRAACALCESRYDAEDLVQETFAQVLKRPRFVRRDHELGYLLRAPRNTY